MKKLLLSLAMFGFAIVGAQAFTFSHPASSFINNGTYLGITNNTLVTNTLVGPTNITYFSYPAGTNVLGNWTNSAGITQGSVFSDCDLFPNANGDTASVAIAITMNVATNYPLPFGVNVWPGNYGTNQPVPVLIPTTASTNVTTFVFATLADGLNVGTSAQDQFTFTITSQGVQPLTVKTNVPTVLLQGARKLRLIKVSTDNSPTSPGVLLDSIRLVGWVP